MSVKKILSLAVVLAMAAAVIPTFGLVASAAADGFVKVDGVGYNIVSENLFPTDLADWTSGTGKGSWGTGSDVIPKHDTVGKIDGSWTTATDTAIGEYITEPYGQSTNCGWNMNRAPLIFVKIDPNKTYYFGMKYRNDKTDTMFVRYGAINEATYTADGGANGTITFSGTGFRNSSSHTSGATLPGTNNAWKDEASIIKPGADADYFIFNDAWMDSQAHSFAQMVLYEVEKAPAAAVTIKLVDKEDGSVLETVTDAENLYVGDSYTKRVNFIIDKNGVKYQPVAGQPGVVSIDVLKANNEVTVEYAKVNGFKTVEVPATADVDYKRYALTDKNYVENPSFETDDGRFSVLSWDSASTKAVYGAVTAEEHGYALGKDGYTYLNGTGFVESKDFAPKSSDYAFGTRYNDGAAGLCSLYKNITVGSGKTFYVSFWVKAMTDDDGLMWLAPVKGGEYSAPDDAKAIWVAKGADNGSRNKDTSTYVEATEWTKVERIITTDANTDTIQFQAYWMGGPGNPGSQPYFLFDDFVVAEAAYLEDAKDTTVNYKVGDKTVKTVTEKIFSDEKAEFDAIELYYEGTVYSAEAQTLNSGEIKDVTMTAITGRTYVTADIYVEGVKVKNPDSANKVMTAAVGNDTSGLTGPGTDADGKTVTDGIHSPSTLGGARVGLMSFPLVDVKDGQQVIAVLPVDHYHDNGYANGNTTLRYSAYALSDNNWTTLAADAELDVMSLKRLSENAMFSGETPRSATEVRFDVTDAVKAAKAAGMKTLDLSLHTAWGGVYYCQLEDIADTAKAAYLTVADGQTITIAGDTPAKVTKNGSVVSAPVVAQAGDVIRAYDANGGKMLLDGAFDYTVSATATVNAKAIVTPAIEAKLGWNGEKFTIDYVAGDVTPVEGAEYAVKVNDGKADLEGGAYNPAKDAGVGFAPNDTNRVYSATSTVTVNGVVFKAEKAVDAGIYGLVMDAVANSELTGQINAKQLEVVNEVLKNGNILLTAGEDGTLKLTDAAAKVMTLDGSTITLTDKAVQLGLKFTSDIGAGKDAATAPTKVGSVSEDGKSVTLPEGVTAAEVVAFSLDSVYLEFVPTEITEGEADAGADFGLVPEL